MGDLIRFPTPATPTANDSTVVLHGCWACGLILFDDELPAGLCNPCHQDLNHVPPPLEHDQRPLAWYLRHLQPATLQSMTIAIVDAGVTRAETQAADWVRDHHLDAQAAHTYVGEVRGRALAELQQRCHNDAQTLGAQLGWWKP